MWNGFLEKKDLQQHSRKKIIINQLLAEKLFIDILKNRSLTNQFLVKID